jgi:hypothetical protein
MEATAHVAEDGTVLFSYPLSPETQKARLGQIAIACTPGLDQK